MKKFWVNQTFGAGGKAIFMNKEDAIDDRSCDPTYIMIYEYEVDDEEYLIVKEYCKTKGSSNNLEIAEIFNKYFYSRKMI